MSRRWRLRGSWEIARSSKITRRSNSWLCSHLETTEPNAITVTDHEHLTPKWFHKILLFVQIGKSMTRANWNNLIDNFSNKRWIHSGWRFKFYTLLKQWQKLTQKENNISVFFLRVHGYFMTEERDEGKKTGEVGKAYGFSLLWRHSVDWMWLRNGWERGWLGKRWGRQRKRTSESRKAH